MKKLLTESPADQPQHLLIVYELPDGRRVEHRFHYLATDADGMTTWQVDPENEEIDVYKAKFVKMDWVCS